ncbi:ankyrin repeat-containing domain protein, partial [Tirmania nivea]
IYGNTPLHHASENGHQEIAKLLIERGVDAAAANMYGNTPLYLASENRHQEIAKLL